MNEQPNIHPSKGVSDETLNASTSPSKSNQTNQTAMDIKAYKYNALSPGAYSQLAAFVITLDATATLHPDYATIIVEASAHKQISDFIANEELAVQCSEIPDGVHRTIEADNELIDVDSLRCAVNFLKGYIDGCKAELAETTKKLSETEKERDRNWQWYIESDAERGRVKEQIKAIAVLTNSIYKD